MSETILPGNVVRLVPRVRLVGAAPSGAVSTAQEMGGEVKDFVQVQLDRRLWPIMVKGFGNWMVNNYQGQRVVTRSFAPAKLGCTDEQFLASAERLFCNKLRFSKIYRKLATAFEGEIILALDQVEYDTRKAALVRVFKGEGLEK